MHSKFLKLQTVFLTLAVLFTSVLVPNQVQALERGSASNAAQTAAITDPNTFDAWYKIQGNNTAAIGRIWADKTVDADPIQFTAGPLKDQSIEKSAGSDFLVALSAMSSTSSTTQAEPIPLDVVMVLDASGSMSDPMSSTDATKRIDALKDAVLNFIGSTADKNAQISDADKKIRLSIVKFAGKTSDKIGNNTYQDGYYTYNYSQIMQNLTVCEDTGAQQLKETVKAIKPAGATRADYGLERAQAALASNPDPARSNAKKVVIFFTDGSPTSSNGFESKVASRAIATAKDIKAAGTEVYTVGIFGGAKPSDSVSNRKTSLENKFMHAVSSNYPTATYTEDWWGEYAFNWGTRAANSNYYLAATSADGLNTVFEDIFRSVATNLTGPTHIEENSNPSSDGYVTFDDTLGSFMEVKDFNGIALADRIYTNIIKKTTNGNVDTYECTDQVTGPVSPAYPQHADLSKVLITVTHSDDRKTGDSVRVRIPASMLPLRHFDLQRDERGSVTSLNVTDTYPIRVLYSVGLKDEVRSDLEAGTSTDHDLVQYVANNAVDGEIHFYSNAYTGKKNSEGITIGDTTASFVPALNNSFYYYTQDTPLYMDKACTEPVTDFQMGQTYYYKLEYYSNQAGQATPTYGFSAIPISISADQDGSVIGQDANGQAYVKKGTKKGSMPRVIDDQIGDKTENITETATRRIDYDWNLKNGFGYLHLGNNGRLGYEAKGSLKITKQVQAADGLTPAADTAFTMQVDLTDSAGTALPGSYRYSIDGTAAGSITSGGTITLKNGQTAEIEGLPAGAKYAVSEVKIPVGYTAAISDSGSGVITAGRVNDTAPVVTVTNTYAPAAYTMEQAFPGSKTLTGRSWLASDSFRFLLEAINPADAPLPAPVQTDATGTHYSEATVTAAQGTTAGTPVDFNFGTVTFTKPGTYVYNIREYTPSTDDRIPGVSYDETVYRATVGITDNGGQLALGSYTLEEIVQENGTTNAPNGNVAAFTNTFNANDEVINFKALKRYVDTSGATRLANGQFHFTLERAATDNLNQTVTTQAPMPSAEGCNTTNTAGGEITFGNITYGTANIGKTYWYTIKEVPGNDLHMAYSNAEYLAKVDVTLENTDTYAGISYYVKQADGSWKPLEGSGDNTPVVFENTYTPTAASATLQLTKTLTGRDWKVDDAFEFTLTGEGNAPMPVGDATVTVKGSTEGHKAAFGAITYQQVGTYRYTITEQATKIPGVAIDKPVTATVTVSYENGALKAAVAYSRGTDSAAFTNTYTAAPYTAPASALFQASKTLTGRDWTDSDSFEFTLTGEGNAPLPPSNQCKASVNRDSTTTTFGNTVLTFNAAGDYVYYITEEPGSIAGVTYDTTKYKVVVSVTDDGTGTLTGTTRYYRVVNGELAPVEGTVAAFTNAYTAASYTAPASALFQVSKTLTGRDWTDSDSFEFTLTGEGNAPLPPSNQCKASVNQKSTTTTFGNEVLTFNAAGDYVYYITEERGSIAGITYDTTKYKVVVSVTDDGTGALTGTTRYYQVVDGVPAPVEGTVAAFTNAYTAAPTDVTLTAHKTLNVESGSWALQGNDFSFALYDNANCTGTPLRTATNTADGSITFEALTFDAAGAYTYYMREVPGDRTAITYDSTVYKVTITVQDNGTGALTALPPVYTLNDKAMGAAEFVNTYTATPGDDTFTLTINKLLTGRAMNAGEFSFELTDSTGAVVSTGTNAADGTVTFSPVGLKAAQEQYSAFLASLPAAVEPEATAAPEATVEPSAAPETTAAPEATAEPEHTVTPEVTAQPEATAQPETTAEPDPTAAPETAPAPEASALPQADGMAAAPMSLVVAPLAAGTQEIQPDFGPDDGIAPDLMQRWYTITEVNTGKTGVTYDRTVYKVLVPLKDSGNGSGTLVVDDEHIQYYRVVDGELAPVEGVTFTNRYAPLSTSVTLGGTKMLNGRALAADEFTFELCDADGTKVLSTATNRADGSFSFAPLAFDAAGTYNYTVREKNTGAARVTYDQTVYTVTVVVRDKDGQLTAEVALPDGGLTFTNTYTPEPTPKPDHKDKPKQTPAPASTAQPAAAAQSSPRTGDNASLMTWVGLLLVCGTALAGLYVYKKRKQK